MKGSKSLSLVAIVLLVQLAGRVQSNYATTLATIDLNEEPAEELDEPEPIDDGHFGDHKQSQETQTDEPKTKSSCPIERRTVIKLPQYFNFGTFGAKFKKAYNAGEAYLRQMVFVKKCLEVFKTRVSYRKGTSTYLTTINKFSDKMTEEFNQIYMLTPPIESYDVHSTDFQAYLRDVEQRRRERAKRLSQVSAIEFESRASLSNNDDDDDECLFQHEQLKKASAEIDNMVLDSLLTYRDLELTMAIRDEINEAAIENVSQAAAGGAASSNELPWPGWLSSMHPEGRQQVVERASLDWTQHECFHHVYDQGSECGMCYVMATTSLAEFYKCTEGGPEGAAKRRQFSKEYVLNCAPKYSPTIMGCAGGSMLETLNFMGLAGVFNIRGWRQRRQEALMALKASTAGGASDAREQLKCPLDPEETPFEQWGPIKVHINPRALYMNTTSVVELVEALQDGPLVVSVQMPPNGVDSYAEGVHDGAGCETSGLWHAMILVGYGRDDQGKLAYLRFRNSFGRDWGMQGHFHLSAEVPSACLGGAVRVLRKQPAQAAELNAQDE